MQFTNYFLASIISFSGLAIGVALVKIAPEEKKPLEKYFLWFRRALLMLIFVFIIFYYYKNLPYLASLILCFVFLLFFEFRLNSLRKSVLDYAAFSFVFFISSKNVSLFAIESSLILLYGVPAASYLYAKKSKNNYKILLYNALFLVIANLLFII